MFQVLELTVLRYRIENQKDMREAHLVNPLIPFETSS